MQTPDFSSLFEYNEHCNKAIISLFEEKQNAVPEKSLQLINHILNAHQIWTERILNEPIGCTVWMIRDLSNFKAINEINHQKTTHILQTADLSKIMNYITSTGIAFSNAIHDILFHVINHSTYHRAQIATDLKNNGIEPLNSDYIFFKRNS